MKKHPEQLDTEFFIGNYDIDIGEDSHVGWNSKRIGVIAYDVDGMVVNGLFPIFVDKNEVKCHDRAHHTNIYSHFEESETDV